MKLFSLHRAAHIKLGRRGEKLAGRLLELKGYRILARNWRCPAGELDIVALDGNEIVFVEVKSLHSRSRYRPAGNLSNHQRRRNRSAAGFYMRAIELYPEKFPHRFDLIEVKLDRYSVSEIRHWHRIVIPKKPQFY